MIYNHLLFKSINLLFIKKTFFLKFSVICLHFLKHFCLPEEKVTEEVVSLPYPKIIQQRLGYITGVFEKTRKSSKHLNYF